jgi:hypothetical protein
MTWRALSGRPYLTLPPCSLRPASLTPKLHLLHTAAAAAALHTKPTGRQGLTLAHFTAQLEDLREHIAHVSAQLEHPRDTFTD